MDAPARGILGLVLGAHALTDMLELTPVCHPMRSDLVERAGHLPDRAQSNLVHFAHEREGEGDAAGDSQLARGTRALVAYVFVQHRTFLLA